jgi:hypothetical protein
MPHHWGTKSFRGSNRWVDDGRGACVRRKLGRSNPPRPVSRSGDHRWSTAWGAGQVRIRSHVSSPRPCRCRGRGSGGRRSELLLRSPQQRDGRVLGDATGGQLGSYAMRNVVAPPAVLFPLITPGTHLPRYRVRRGRTGACDVLRATRCPPRAGTRRTPRGSAPHANTPAGSSPTFAPSPDRSPPTTGPSAREP